MFTMYDSVDVDQIPAEPHAVAAYINGEYANYDAVKAKFPHARILKLSVTGEVAAEGYDIEKGDYEPDQVPHLYQLAKDGGIWRPCFYAQLSGVMPSVKAQLNTVVSTRKDVRLWVAYYDDVASLTSEYDAHQFTEKALGRNLDESLCASDFFEAVKPAAPAAPKEPWKATVTVDTETGKWNVEGVAAT